MVAKAWLLHACMVGLTMADLRMSGHPRNGYGLINGGNTRWMSRGSAGDRNKLYNRYMIPSVFAYKGLKYPGGQKYNNYDNFLRSNIDNEQDNRDFNNERGRDHLPFRTLETKVETRYNNNRFDGATPRTQDLRKWVNPGESVVVPLRWNNPHAGEMEVNVWIFDHGASSSSPPHPVVIPVRKPVCSGEGHQDHLVMFTIPKDFTQLGSKIPGFKGCNENSRPMCTLQVY